MVAYTKPQQRKKEESEWLRGERDQIKFIDLRFESWQVGRFRKARVDMLELINYTWCYCFNEVINLSLFELFSEDYSSV